MFCIALGYEINIFVLGNNVQASKIEIIQFAWNAKVVC